MKNQENYKTIDGLNFMRDCAKNISNLEEIRNNKKWDKTAIDLGNFVLSLTRYKQGERSFV